jgi:hypothetical protein
MKWLKITILLLMGASALARAGCPEIPEGFNPGMQEDQAGKDGVVVHYRTDPEKIPVGELFVMDIIVCIGNMPWMGSLGVDASMPAHGHGMNYEPEVSSKKAGHFFAQGFLFQMPGQWRFEFSLGSEAGTRHVYSFVDI